MASSLLSSSTPPSSLSSPKTEYQSKMMVPTRNWRQQRWSWRSLLTCISVCLCLIFNIQQLWYVQNRLFESRAIETSVALWGTEKRELGESTTTESLLPSQLFNRDRFVDHGTGDGEEEQQQKQPIDTFHGDDHQQPPPTEHHQLAWLMSFPNSGTTYTLMSVEWASNRSIASNYGLNKFMKHRFPEPEPIPVHATVFPQGPFWQGHDTDTRFCDGGSDLRFGSTARPLPDLSSFLLTKTHCGGYCVTCIPKTFLQNSTAFVQACAQTLFWRPKPQEQLQQNDTDEEHNTEVLEKQDGSTALEHVASAVHLVRDPLHNIVSRFHHEIKTRKRQKVAAAAIPPNNATGFRMYCAHLDNLHPLDQEWPILEERLVHIQQQEWAQSSFPLSQPSSSATTDQFRTLLGQIPCRNEFIRYIQWHNHVLHSVLPALGRATNKTRTIPVYTLYYEDYATDLPHTMESLLSFLKLPNVIAAATGNQTGDAHYRYRPFHLSNYTGYYTPTEKMAIALVLKTLATPTTWRRIRHYVDQMTSQQ